MGSRPLWEFDLKDDGTASLRITPADELDPERRADPAKDLDLANWPERSRQSWEAMQGISARGEPSYAVADRFIEENVLAVVVRDPETASSAESSTAHGSGAMRMVIVPVDASDDTSACFGQATLRRDEMELFNAPARRVP